MSVWASGEREFTQDLAGPFQPPSIHNRSPTVALQAQFVLRLEPLWDHAEPRGQRRALRIQVLAITAEQGSAIVALRKGAPMVTPVTVMLLLGAGEPENRGQLDIRVEQSLQTSVADLGAHG